MKNTHLEHPEDTILTGDLSVLDWFTAQGELSAKIDGAPAIVWGLNPATGNFFVGTKSVFNKKKIKINETHQDIDANHGGIVGSILHKCLDHLPRIHGIIQGDFVGFGGDNMFCPNTISYVFPEIVTQEIIIAPHTAYIANEDLRDAFAYPIGRQLESTDEVLFVQPQVALSEHLDDIADYCKFAKQMAMMVEFTDDRTATKIKKHINACIKDAKGIDEDEIAQKFNVDINLIRLWKLVESIKLDMFAFITCDDSITCLIQGEVTEHEGYVMTNDYGMYKIVNRDMFSFYNFTLAKNWS